MLLAPTKSGWGGARRCSWLCRIRLCTFSGRGSDSGSVDGPLQVRVENLLRGRQRGWSAAFGGRPKPNDRTGAFNSLRLGLAQLGSNIHIEDRFAYDELFVNGSSLFLVAVFDGSGGWQVAHFLERELLPLVREKLRPDGGKMILSSTNHACTTQQHDPELVGDALKSSYEELDAVLKGKIQQTLQLGFDRFACIGSCACTVAVTDNHYVIANSGDCKAVLGKMDGKVVALSRVHNANVAAERERVRAKYPDDPDVVQCHKGGSSEDGKQEEEEGDCYIKGVLQPTRAFGFFGLKTKEMNRALLRLGLYLELDFSQGPYLSASPDIRIEPRDMAEDEVIVVGSDGLYDELSDQDVIDIARSAGSPAAAAGALLKTAKARALANAGISQRDYDEQLPVADRRNVHDDMTVAVFYLQYPKMWRKHFHYLSSKLQQCCDRRVNSVQNYNAAYLWSEEDTEQYLDMLKRDGFSVCVADPDLEDCPLIAVSRGFAKLTGYEVEESIGRNCRFLSYGVPAEKYDDETTARLRAYTKLATSGDPFILASGGVSPPTWAKDVPGGGSYFCRWNRRRDGELFQNLFVLRQIWAGEKTYIVGFQARIPEKLSAAFSTDAASKESLKGAGALFCTINRLSDKIASAIAQKIQGWQGGFDPEFVEESDLNKVCMKIEGNRRAIHQ